ncbi:uncharacterized protein [Ptychodera flava]|uniref:uncharacterized protein n=1 Tax=Ptychodera flava TaxID=63121 RepID=UPI00396A80FF
MDILHLAFRVYLDVVNVEGLHWTGNHGNRLSLTLNVKNGGFIYINNFDQEDSTAIDGPFFYEGNTEEKSSVYVFDFLPPVHSVCRNDTDCSAKVLNISHPYTKNKNVTIRWLPEEWVDEPAGIHHYDCEAFQLTSNTSEDNLDMHSKTPVAWQLSIRPWDLETTLPLPDPGVYAIIMTLYDSAGNSAKVRRFVVYDDVSEISITVTRPITAAEAVQNGGVFWITQSKVSLSWDGLFYNSLHRDKYMLNGIAELEPWPRMYDEVTGQPPTSRSREAIHNTDGIVFFQIDYAMSSSGSAEPHNWTLIRDAKIEIYIPPPDPESQSRNERLTVWLRAHDVIGHTANDSVVFYIDRTNPVITNVTFTEDSKRTPGVQRSHSKRR